MKTHKNDLLLSFSVVVAAAVRFIRLRHLLRDTNSSGCAEHVCVCVWIQNRAKASSHHTLKWKKFFSLLLKLRCAADCDGNRETTTTGGGWADVDDGHKMLCSSNQQRDRFGASTAAIDFQNMKWLCCVLNIADYMVDERRCSLMELIRAQQSNYKNFERIKWFQENWIKLQISFLVAKPSPHSQFDIWLHWHIVSIS